jgi:hypothetical protein
MPSEQRAKRPDIPGLRSPDKLDIQANLRRFSSHTHTKE